MKLLAYTLRGLGILLLLLLITCGVVLCISLDTTEAPPLRPACPDTTARLQQHVNALCQAPRHGTTKLIAHDYIVEQFRRAGWQVRLQHLFGSDGQTHYNIVASRPGASKQRCIIGAHYDSCDTGKKNPGADDNASAVAVLLELARTLPHTPQTLGIELIAWDCEEPPYFDTPDMGSAQHAALCKPEEVSALICLEMLGYYSDAPDSQPQLFPGHSLLLPTVGNFVAVVGDWGSLGLARRTGSALSHELPTVRLNVPFSHATELWFSDHRNYAPRGIPSIMVTDTAMLRNPHYHEPTDTPATLNYEHMARITRALTQLVSDIVK